MALGVAGLIFGVVGYKFLTGGFFIQNSIAQEAGGVAQAKAEPAATPLASTYSWSKVDAAVPVAGCISAPHRSKCMCFSADGVTLDMPNAQCQSIISNPLPRQFTANKRNHNKQT